MLRLRKILLCNYVYYIFFFLTICITILRICLPRNSNYLEESNEFSGKIIDIKEKDDSTKLYIQNQEIVIGTYKGKEIFHLGDWITVKGLFTKPSKNTTKYLFNYQAYCYRKNIFYLIDIESVELERENRSLYYFIKEKIKNRVGKDPYLNALLLGDKSYITNEVKRSYQENGISHLFAISGMHISLLAGILEKILKRIKWITGKEFFIISLFLITYLFFVGLSPSFLRGVLFYLLFSINKIYYFYIDSKNLFFSILFFSLLINPNYIFDVGFWYSYSISFALMIESKNLQSKNYLISLGKVSLLSFLVSFPITIFTSFQINILSIIYNLFFVPFMSFFLFPFTLLTFLLKPLDPIYHFFTNIMEEGSILISHISVMKLIWKRLPLFIYVIYFFLLFIYLFTKKKKILIGFLFLASIHFFIPYLDSSDYLQMIDVGQGDSFLISLHHQAVLIDTGGLYQEGDVFYNTLYPLLKSLGISKLRFLVLSHGDKDHIGEAITLVKNFKVEKVIFNCGEYNDLEQELIKVLKKKKIKYATCIEELNINNHPFYFLNTKEYDNENDNSNVIYTEINDYQFLFMGDAGIKKEKDLLREYNLPEIDVLKVGHHGSKTCSSKEFIDTIKPKYSLISVGKNNKFKHPNEEVLSVLKDSEIYRTDQNGSVMVKIKNNRLKIESFEIPMI